MIRVFYNPLAKSHQGKKECDRYTAALTSAYEVYNVLDYEFLEPLLQTFDSKDDIVVLGGDGTFSQFVRRRGNHEGNIRFVRAGTGNDYLRSTGFDDVLYTKEYDRPVVTTSQVTPFINTFGLGISNGVLLDYNKNTKKNTWTYFKATLKNFFTYQPSSIKVSFDGQSKEFYKAYLVAVQTGKFFGGGMMVTPNADMKDGLVDVIIVHSISRLRLFQVFPTIYKGSHLKYKQFVHYQQAKEVLIESPKRELFSVDGELSNHTSTSFHITLK